MVPRSAKLVKETAEAAMYTLTLLKVRHSSNVYKYFPFSSYEFMNEFVHMYVCVSFTVCMLYVCTRFLFQGHYEAGQYVDEVFVPGRFVEYLPQVRYFREF